MIRLDSLMMKISETMDVYLCEVIITVKPSSSCMFLTGLEVADITRSDAISQILVCVGSEGGAPQLRDFLTDCHDPALSTEHLFLSLRPR